MKFYHMELATTEPIKIFIPRIPHYIMKGEDETFPRICVSPTLQGCLSAAPWGGTHLEDHALGTLYRVYVFESEDYISPNIIKKKYGVLDAIMNEEYWLIEEIQPICNFVITIDSFDYDFKNMDNGKNHTLIVDLNYRIVDNESTGNIVNLKPFKNEEKLYEFISFIIEAYFLQLGEFLEDFMDTIHIKNDIMYIDDDLLFFKDLFYEKLNDINEIQFFENLMKYREEVSRKIC